MDRVIYIVGAGAIGKALAVFLQQQGKSVVLLRGSADDEPNRNIPITVHLPEGTTIKEDIRLSTIGAENFENSIIVMANKSFANKTLAEKIKSKRDNARLVIMQNGLGVEDPFLSAGFPNVYRCVLFATSQVIDDGNVRYKPVAASMIGKVKGESDYAEDIVAALTSPLFRFQKSSEINRIAWKKTIANCVFNSICPLIEVDNGIFHRDGHALSIASQVVDECIAVANFAGVSLTSAEVMESVLQISKASDGQLISTLQDIRNGRPTEIETLNFAIAAIAASYEKPSLTTKTKLLGELTLLKSIAQKN